MLVRKAVQFVLTVTMLWGGTQAVPTKAVKFCGRQLSEIMSRVCQSYNTPTWDVPTVEQPGATARRKRQVGIVDECCVIGCTWEQLSEYCSFTTYSESPVEDLESHNIADRSAEVGVGSGKVVQAPIVVGTVGSVAASGPSSSGEVSEASERTRRREVGGARTRGYGRARTHAPCWCRRKRRSGRRRPSLMGNTELLKSVRAAPVVGTVSPLITWGRTLNTDLPTFDRDRYAYVVYT